MNEVEYMTHSGDDLLVVNVARVSMHKRSTWANTFTEQAVEAPKLQAKDVRLIRYLATHSHWTPFAHPQVTMRFKMPFFVARQWFKHRVGINRWDDEDWLFVQNEVSRRYVEEAPEFWQPDTWLGRPEDNIKQGSGGELPADISAGMTKALGMHQVAGQNLYENFLKCGTSPEMARTALPVSTMTEFIETGSLAAYARVYALRSPPDAQREVRWFAGEIDCIMRGLYPVSWEALTRG